MKSDDRVTGRSSALRALARFWHDSSGAVTVDWVALTGFILFLGMATAFYVSSSVPVIADKVGAHLSSTTVVPN